MNDEDRGLYEKFTVLRNDGSSGEGRKHDKCEYFVLDLSHDPHARNALIGYFTSLIRANSHKKLCYDLSILIDALDCE